MDFNGIAHTQLLVDDLAACRPFYRELFGFLGMTIVVDGPRGIYGVGCRTAIGVSRTHDAFRGQRYTQGQPGLHHICLRATSRDAIDRLHAFVVQLGANILQPPKLGPWAPGYYSVLFEDPDGLRLEANYIPGKGNLSPAIRAKLPFKTLPGYEDYPTE